ncbi:efflux RND transporter permease subunit [Tengunoibacter tsumagoiensis]|uniref:Hydrogenase expression protein n=1 Tax=Tengunoibacter tsumagoiensis TaxID=2014871 RepID=A0A402A6M6_9CHLR|nr:efflux RND transporter permease subunit [Tengunoibacter tsumagoiensis]GCE14641.1 hydrogenase expression protein [Tengunoibacter tsumagoiensis]
MLHLTKWNIVNRGLIALATVGIFLFGLFTIPFLKQELLPSIQYPAVGILTPYAGASPSIIEQEITKPIEQSLLGGQGVQKITSYSSQGTSLIIVYYDFGTDINAASQQIAQQITRVQATLPTGVNPQTITESTSSIPVVQLSVTSAEDAATLGADLKTTVVPALQGISGVSSVQVTGLRNSIVSIQVDPQKLQEQGVQIAQIQAALQGSNALIPAGEINDHQQTWAVRVDGNTTDLQSLQDLVIGQHTCARAVPGSNCQPGTPIRLTDVASVQQELAPSSTLTRTNGEPSIGVAVFPGANGNTVTISAAVKDQLSSLEHKIGHHTSLTVISDTAPPITNSIESLIREGLLGALFAIIVILIFLLSIRSTLVTAISIPLSVVVALIGLKIEGYTLNIFTLAGLTIAIGRVIDDSIVVLENIYRHLQMGEPREEAIPIAVREVGVAVIASTLTTVAVFLPLGFTGGIIGVYFRPFALVVTIALLASLVVALFVIPVLAYWFLKVPTLQHEQKASRPALLERLIVPPVRWTTNHRFITVGISVLLLLATLFMTSRLGFGFIGNLEQNTFSLSITLPVGSSIDRTNRSAMNIEQILKTTSGVKTYQVTMGNDPNSGGLSGGNNIASFTIITDEHSDAKKVQDTVQSRVKALPDVGLVQVSGSSSSGNSAINIDIQANNEADLATANTAILNAVSRTANTTNVTSNLSAATNLMDVKVNAQKAAGYGLSTIQVGQLLRQVYSGQTITTINLGGKPQDVDLQINGKTDTIDDMQNLLLPSAIGSVKLGDIADIAQTKGPSQITHLNGTRTATISLTPTTNNTSAVTADLQKELKAVTLPSGVTAAIGGVAQQQSDAFAGLGLSLLAAILLVFLVMVATFRSILYPLILLVAIPFASIGSVLLLLVTGSPLDVPAFIGLLMLVGIVVTNAIVLLDRILHYRAAGMSAQEAVLEGTRHRVRPILMTAIATICALLPLALGLSGSSGFISSTLALTVIGGLATSTLLTLLLVPTLYVMFTGKKKAQTQNASPSFAQPYAPSVAVPHIGHEVHAYIQPKSGDSTE